MRFLPLLSFPVLDAWGHVCGADERLSREATFTPLDD